MSPLCLMAQQKVTINPSETCQTIEGFGAADAWTTEYVSDFFPKSEKEKAAQWLFSTEMDALGNPLGIGLSMWRVNIGAGSATQSAEESNISDETRRVECFLNADGTYDWTREDGQQWFMSKAKDYGVNHFILFANSAPIYYTLNGKAVNNSGAETANLRQDSYDDYAKFLATVTKHFEDEGYGISYVSPLNEPSTDWTSGQEGSRWANADIAHIAREIDKSFAAAGVKAKAIFSETDSWDKTTGGWGIARNQMDQLFKKGSSDYIGDLSHVAKTFCAHDYWTFRTNDAMQEARQTAREKADNLGLDLQMSEWSMLDAAPDTSAGFPASYDAAQYIDISLYMAKLIQNDLRVANVTSWNFWTAMATEVWGQKNRFCLLRLQPYSGDYGSLRDGGTIASNTNLWVLGNFSRFIRPGYRRIGLTGADDMNGLYGSAFISPDRDKIVAVFVNTSKKRVETTISLSDADLRIASQTRYQTSSSRYLKHLGQVGEDYTPQVGFAARTVTTLVYDLSSANGITQTKTAPVTDNRYYTLSGMAVEKPLLPGIYVRGGRKVVVR